MRKLGITKRKHGLRPFVRMKLRNNTQKEYYKVVQRSKEPPFETAIKVKSESKLISAATHIASAMWLFPHYIHIWVICMMERSEVYQ